MTGQRKAESWHSSPKDKNEVGFYTLKAAVELVFQRLGIAGYRTDEAPADEFSYGLRYHKGPMVLADFGQVLPLAPACAPKSKRTYSTPTSTGTTS